LFKENPDNQENQCPHTNGDPHVRILDSEDIPKKDMEEVCRTLGNTNQDDT